ncbi:response regulator receiver modulated diguanylate cyclase/phosphodiesterase with PAS/PAC sensor(s) [Trichodesmium erythraeum IMS101]|uniref:Response regulator receiver modulated diguanylate cyclase/phosphodiesterase with PAS/PAC sensor(S) n=1 Tax=Trichodesmium erythraeum (strain IMS101) TaxID=203124 RepID=Q10V30_TRIEI|nr:EAL domain-containing protein [Trichodesmium erythraeum GBRTRLIN201]
MIEIKHGMYQIRPAASQELHLLIVEDVMEDVELIIQILKSDGIKFTYDYDIAKSYLDYRQLLKDNVYDAILSDYHVVHSDIFEVLGLLQQSEQEIPLILIAEELEEKEALKVLKAGVNSYVLKNKLFTLSIILERAIAEYKLKKEQQLTIKKLEQQVQQKAKETAITSQLEPIKMLKDMHNITEGKQARKAKLENERRLRALIENTTDLTWIIDAHGTSSYVSPSVMKTLGYVPEEVVSQSIFDLIHINDLLLVTCTINKAIKNPNISQTAIKYRVKNSSGSWCFFEGILTNFLDDPGVRGIIINSHDITQRKLTEERWKYNVFHDALTHLPNHDLFIDRLEEKIKETKCRKKLLFAVLLVDIDRFKVLNNRFGHQITNKLIVMIAKKLKTLLNHGNTVARLSPDEFGILLENISDISDATYIADQINKQLTLPIILDGNEIFINPSIGIAVGSRNISSAEHILQDAEIAMYHAKNLSRGSHQVFCNSMRSQFLQRVQLENDLQSALNNIQSQSLRKQSEFILYYQPIVSLATNEITGFEALVRWQHPKLGFISPDEFIPLAEETGLIIPLGLWILREACFQLRKWQNQLPNNYHLNINVNLSAKQFAQVDLIDQIDKILLETQLDGKSLKLEITESTLIENNESIRGKMSRLRARNIDLYIDDFGTGYSSFNYLYNFPMNTLKIDRSFINRIGLTNLVNNKSIKTIEILRSIITLSHNLGINVVAEGVETPEQALQLQALKCEYAQGYLFSKPLDMTAATGLVAQINNQK